jgi:dihydroneopterin aldolase
MTGWLASIVGVDEVRQVLAAGAHIVDAKNPHAGALGALPHNTVRGIVEAVADRVPVSATIGDFPDMQPASVCGAVIEMAATGVDFVKIGLFPSPALADCLQALAPLARRQHLVAVMFADLDPDFSLAARLAELGFSGVMLDTANKRGGGLLAHQALPRLAEFVVQARRLNLLTGLAGSLKLADIPPLTTLNPDYLGFRGALCRDRTRTQTLDPDAMAAIAQAMRGGAVPAA